MALGDTFFPGTTPRPGGRASRPVVQGADDSADAPVAPPQPAPAAPASTVVAPAPAAPSIEADDDDTSSGTGVGTDESNFPVATNRPTRSPSNRFNYTVFSANPILAKTFAPEIAGEQQAQAQDAQNAVVAQRQAAAAEKADQQARVHDHNASMTAQAATSGMRTVKDANGMLQPLQDDQGRTLYHPHVGAVQYKPDGTPFQETRDEFGNVTSADPDAAAPVGPNVDNPADPQLYRQNQHQPWKAIGHVDDLAADQAQPEDVRKAAGAWQKQRGKLVAQAGVQAAERDAAQAQAKHVGAQNRVQDLTTQNTALEQQIDALNQDPAANQTAGGFFGIGSHPTDAAANLAARRADLEKQQAGLQEQLNDARAQLPALEAKMKATTADAAITRHGLNLSNYQSLADQRRALLKTQGKPERGDPILAAIQQKTDEFNVKLSAAREAKAALTPTGSPADPSLAAPAPSPSPAAPPPAPPIDANTTPASPAAPEAPTPPPASAGSDANAVSSPQPIPNAQAGQDAPAAPATTAAPAAPAAPADAKGPTDGGAKTSPTFTLGQRAKNDAGQVVAGVLNTPFAAGKAFWLTAAQAADVATPEERAKDNQTEIVALRQNLAQFEKRKTNPRYQSDPTFRSTIDTAIAKTQASIERRTNTPQEAPLSPGDQAKAQFLRDLSTQARDFAGVESDTMKRVEGNVGVDPAQAQNTDSRIFGALGSIPKTLIPAVGPALIVGDAKANAYDAKLAELKPQVDSGAMTTHDAQRAADTSSTVEALKQLPILGAYGVSSNIVGAAAKSLLARTQISSPVWRAAIQGVGALASNVAASTATRGAEAALSPDDPHAWDKVLPTWESVLSGDLPFALIHTGHSLGAERENASALAEGQAHLNAQAALTSTITPQTAADHLPVPTAPTSAAAVSDAALAENFAKRNPNAPKLDPAVVAKAREFAPPGEEQTVAADLHAADALIDQHESELAAVPLGDPEKRLQAQAQLAQSYEQKAAIVSRGDARLLAVQQISAIPDWQPPTDPTTGQPTETADPNRTRETVGALLKVANGFGPDDLTSAEQARLKNGGDPTALTRKAPDGSTILTDAGRQTLASAAPAAVPLIQGTEAADLRARQKPAQTPGVPPAPETRADRAPDAADAPPPPPSESTPPGEKPTSSSSQPNDSTAGPAAPLADRLYQRLRDQVAGAGKNLTPEQETRARQLTTNAAFNLDTPLQKYRRAFRSIGMDIVHDEAADSGGVHSPGPGEIRISLDDILHPANLDSLQNPARADRAIQEEAIHAIAQHLESRGEIDPTAVWQSLPDVLKRRIESAYPDMPDDRVKGHEALRMLVQGKLNMSREGWKLDGNLVTEQSDPGLFAQSRQALFKVFKFFRDLHGTIIRAGGRPEDAKLIADTADRIQNVFRGVVDSPDDVTETSPHDAGAPAAQEPPGRAPPVAADEATRGEGVIRGTGRDPAEEKGAVSTPTLDRAITDDERARAAAGLGVHPDQIGHVADVTSSTGQRVRTAYVAREAADARPSHNPEGVPTPGYPQDFQPRDRSGTAYRRQAQNIAGSLDLDRLADSPRPDEGSPIVTASGHTLTGNGRDIAIGLAHREGLPAAAKYKARLFQRAPEFGLDRAAIARMRQPVLHRVILGHESPDALRRFSEDSNASPAMQSNALEVASQDAKRLTPALLSLFDPNYNLESGKNADFLKAFGQQVVLGRTRVGDGTANELNMSPADLARRARLALFAAAYGGDDAGRAALERMGGDSEDNGRNISQALLTLAPVMARLRADGETGDLHPGYDISRPLVRAAQEISETVANRPAKQSSGAAIDGLLAQQTFDADPLERAALGFFARNRANRTALEEGLSHYAEQVYGLGNPKDGADMFGERQMPSPLALFMKAASPTLQSQRAALRPNAVEKTRRAVLEHASAVPSESRLQPTQRGTDYNETRAENATVAGPAVFTLKALRAYHGTPHEVDRFSSEKIGTGEGAQVYGHGLYFAEHPDVANMYAARLSDPTPATGSAWKELRAALQEDDLLGFDSAREALEGVSSTTNWRSAWEMSPRTTTAFEKYFGSKGNRYTVHLDAEQSDLLDWDKPFKQQSPELQQRLRRLVDDHLVTGGASVDDFNDSGRELYRALGNPRRAATMLNEAGVPGIRYLDQGSRGDGTGTSNYVIFDDSKIRITHRNGESITPDASVDTEKPLLTQRSQAADETSETSSSHPIDDLLALLDGERGEKIDAAQDKAATEQPGQRTVGRPDLAFGGASDAHRAVDQQRADEHVAQTQAEWNAEADRRFKTDPVGEARNLATKALNGEQLSAVETKIAQRAVAAELAKPDSPEQRRKVQAMIYGYRMTGTEQARAMAARFDPHQTPAERHKEFLGRVIYTPPPEVRRKLDALPAGDRAGRQAILDADQQRVSRIESELKKMGVSFDDIFRGEVQLRLKGAQIIQNTAGELFDGGRQRALKLLQGGARSFSDVASSTGLKESEVKQAYSQMREALKAKLRDKVRRGATAENLDASTLRSQMAGGEADGAGIALKSDAETEAELDRILAQMGFGDPAKVGKTKVRQPKKAIFRPPAAAADPAQIEAWKRGGVGDDVRAKIPVGQSGLDFGERPPTGTGERAGTRFVRPAGDEQGRIDFADQEPARGGGTGERAGAKFLQGEQGRIDIDDGPPVASSLDLSDPVVASRLSRAIQSVDSNLYDKIFEFWSAGLLSGPQTHVAIGVGNTLNAGFELTVQRGMEALLNTAYRDPNSAQFGELKYILRGILPGIRAGLSVGLKSFQAEASMFEQTYLDQQMALDPGEHMNAGHKVAIQGKLGKIVRLPFRAVGFMDGFMKASIFHMEVAGQAYRMAKAEGLKGALLAKRMAELSGPGGEAAIRAVGRAEEMIGQAPYLAEGNPQQEADDHAKRVDAAYRQARAEGKTGDAITERATELLRKPDTGGWRRFVPPGVEHNPMDVAMSKFHEMARSTKLLSYVFPYLRMPYNLMKMGLRKSPLGVTNVAARLINAGLYKMKEGKPIFESYPAALQTRHLAEQAFAWTAAALLYSAVEGDGEDDRKKRVLITGTRAFHTDKQGERDLLERTSGGALTLRIGDTTINYGRYEPIASVLGTLADGVRSIKAMHNGATKHDAIDKFMGYISDQVMAKTMLQGMSDLAKDVEGGAGTADRAKRAIMTAVVPNIIRQPLRNLDDYVRDTHGAPSPYAFFPMGGYGEKKLTPYGQPVEKTSNPLARILAPAAVKPAEHISNADRLLMNWNAKHPGEQWAPEPLSRKKPDLKTGKETEMTNEEYAAFQRRAAAKVNAKLAGIVSSSNAAHPTAEDLHKVKQAFQQAHHEAKEEAFGNKKEPVPMAPLPKATPKPRDISTMMGWE